MNPSHERRLATLALLVSVLLGWASGCDLGTPQSRLPNTGTCTQPLSCYDDSGNHTAYFQTGDLNTPRYLHGAAVTAAGTPFIVAGSDERGLSALDTIEFFDQCGNQKDTPPPASGSGLWIDTNFEGDPITLSTGPRIYHSVTALGASSVLVVIGGSTNILGGTVYPKAEIYEPASRTFRPTDADMLTPRFRHTTVQLGGGDLFIAGGQYETTNTVVNEEIPEGFPGRTEQVTVFPSTPNVEVFLTNQETFDKLLVVNTNEETRLLTPRGRADHHLSRFAGPDNLMNTGDDLWVIAGGFQTLSAVTGLAPRTKIPGAVGRGEAGGVLDFEVFDQINNVFRIDTTVQLNSTRANGVQVMNLGRFNNYTPDGVPGMGNGILVTHGNTDLQCPVTPLFDQVLVATFALNAGPLEGLRFFHVEEPSFFSHIQGTEYKDPPVTGTPTDPIGRCAVNAVSLPRPLPGVQGVDPRQTWVFSLAGVDIFLVLGVCVYNYGSPTMLAGCVFDPFFSLPAVYLNNAEPRNLSIERRANPQNYLGIVGVWFTNDGFISESIDSFGTTPDTGRWAQHNGVARVFGYNFQIPGDDGAMGTIDDRILLAGGGTDYPLQGGEPTSPSAEIFVPLPACLENNPQ